MCADTSRDASHCGGCGRACEGGQACVSGSCQASCPPGQTACGGRCTDPASDAANCGRCGAACSSGQRCVAGGCVGGASSVRVAWSFPALWSFSPSPDTWLPTYVTHLMGVSPPVSHPLQLDLVCARVQNAGATTQRVDLEVRVPTLADPRMQSVTLAAGATQDVCVTPVFNSVLRGLRAEQPGAIEAYARLADGSEVARTMRSFTATPSNAVLWGGVASRPEMGRLAAVFVTPNDPTVLSLRPAVERRSVFPGGFGGGAPFDRPAYPRASTIAVGQHVLEVTYLRRGALLPWRVSSVTGGADADIDVYAFTADQYVAWRDRSGTAAVSVWRDRLSGATGSFTAPTDGFYALVLFNTNDNFVSRSVSWTRGVTLYDVSFDALRSIFEELRARGIVYTNLGTSYFDGWQRIRRPAESLTMRTANCIDGALLFASILEGAGLPPYLILVPGHAYVGVRMGPNADDPVLPIETTMVGGTQTALQAVDCALGGCPLTAGMPRYLIDLTRERAAGIRPIP